MDYRLRYRDIPWSVALFVLPGKIIGGYVLRPIAALIEKPSKYLMKFLKLITIILLVLIATTIVLMAIDLATGGAVGLKKATLKAIETRAQVKAAEEETRVQARILLIKSLAEEIRKERDAAEKCYKDAHGRCR